MFDLSPQVTVDHGFIEILQDLLSDPNPMVIANSISALSEITEMSTKRDLFVVNGAVLTKLLAALNECTEYILQYLSALII
jgi:AP-2 complex subunit beta-1/AP-1 complex subunit beta-1